MHSSKASVPLSVVSNCELSSETTNLLSMSKLVQLGKDGLPSSLPTDLMSVIENSLGGASVSTTSLTTDGTDVMRTLTADEERAIQEIVQVSICSQPARKYSQAVVNYVLLYHLSLGLGTYALTAMRF